MEITWDNADNFKTTRSYTFKLITCKCPTYYVLLEGKNGCNTCGAPVFIDKRDYKTRGKEADYYCSNTCFANRFGKKIKRNCYWCGKEVVRRKSKFSNKNICFCSKDCRNISTNLNHGRYTADIKYYNGRVKVTDTCLWCGVKINRRCIKYCSKGCATNYKYHINLNKWYTDQYDFKETIKCPFFIRKHLWEKFDGKCSRCGWAKINPLLKRAILEVEHIDGDCMNHRWKNVDLICTNCHTLTPTYRALNKGNPKRNKNITYGGRSLRKS